MSMSFSSSLGKIADAYQALCRHLCWVGAILLVGLLSYLPIRLIIATLQAPSPQAVLTLGGGDEREIFTAEFAKTHPDLEIWISSGMDEEKANLLFQSAGVEQTRIHYDRRATDTITNFTTLVDVLQQQHIRHIYLITCDFHMPRATAIATIVLGHRGIRVTPIVVPSPKPRESSLRVGRDIVRSIVWMFTGQTGAEFRSQNSIAQLNYHIFGSNAKR
jgi:uncharacterized SAM-binding protein YcdF (DUF218 family)